MANNLSSTLRPTLSAMAAVCLAHLVELAQLVSPERTASLALLAFLALPESRRLLPASRSLHRHASLARKDPPAHPDHQDQLATQDHPAMLASQALTHHPANQDPRDPPDHPERLDHPDHLEMPEPQPRASQPPPESPESPEMLDHPDQLDPPASLARMDSPDQLDPRDPPAPMDHPEPMASLDLPAHPAPPDHRARRVSAPSTAPSMAVSSSKMEQDDKQQFIWQFPFIARPRTSQAFYPICVVVLLCIVESSRFYVIGVT